MLKSKDAYSILVRRTYQVTYITVSDEFEIGSKAIDITRINQISTVVVFRNENCGIYS